MVSASAGDFEEGELVKGVKAGDRLKVKESRIVYHSPKHKVQDLFAFCSESRLLLDLESGSQLTSHASGD